MAVSVVLEIRRYHSATGFAPSGSVSITHCHPPVPLRMSQAVSLNFFLETAWFSSRQRLGNADCSDLSESPMLSAEEPHAVRQP